MRRRIAGLVLASLLSGERLWAGILGFLLTMAAALIPLVLLGWLDPKLAFLMAWLPAIACAIAAHVYRGRALMWEALCHKARREGNEFIEGFLQEPAAEPEDSGRMLN